MNEHNLLSVHFGNAKLQRSTFNESVKESRIPSNMSSIVQITFDFAERTLIPRFTEQPKSYYYKIGLKS